MPIEIDDWECGTRLMLSKQHGDPMQVVAIAKAGAAGWMVMRAGGDIRTMPEVRLRKWSAADPCWEGPEEPLEIPEALRLVIEYLEAKPAALANPAAAAALSPRQKAGMLIRTAGTEGALAACRRMPQGWDRSAVARALSDAGCGVTQPSERAD